MLRDFARSIRKPVVAIAIVGICCVGFPPIAAASSRESNDHAHYLGLEIWRLVDTTRLAAALKAGPSVESLATVRAELSIFRVKLNAFPRGMRSPSVEKLILRLDVALATTPEAYHAAMKRLYGVGKSDTAFPSFLFDAPHAAESGPSDSVGPCTDGDAGPCATVQQMNTFLAQLDAETGVLEDIEHEYDVAHSAEPDYAWLDEGIVSGPSAESYCAKPDCFQEGASAAGSLLVAAAGIATADAKAGRAIATGTRVAVAFLSWWTVAAVGAVVIAGAAVAGYTNCRMNPPPKLAASAVVEWFEPVMEVR